MKSLHFLEVFSFFRAIFISPIRSNKFAEKKLTDTNKTEKKTDGHAIIINNLTSSSIRSAISFGIIQENSIIMATAAVRHDRPSPTRPLILSGGLYIFNSVDNLPNQLILDYCNLRI